MKMNNLKVLTVFILAAFISGCVEDPPVDPPVTSGSLTFHFDHHVDSAAPDYFNIVHTNEAGNSYSIYAIKYLISNIELIKEDDTRLELTDVYGFINAEDERTELVLSDIDFASYKGIKFQIGVDDDAISEEEQALLPQDHPLNPILNGMHWSWSGGYRFVVMEGQYTDDMGAVDSYSFHIGDEPNKFDLSFTSIPFEFDKDMTASFSFNVNEFFRNPNVYDITIDENDFTHSGEDGGKAATIVENLKNAWTLEAIN